MKYIALLGKGGVGKTTLAVDLANVLKQYGSVCVVGLDQQHNHKDIIELNNYDIPYECMTPLITEWILFVIEQLGIKGYRDSMPLIASDFFAMMNLAELLHRSAGKYDYVIMDFPPNTSGLFMVKYPNILENWVYKALTIKQRVKKMLTGSSDVMDKINYLYSIALELKNTFDTMDFYIVGIPTFLGVSESKKAFQHLKENGLKPKAFIMNMVQPIPETECEICFYNYNTHNDFLSDINEFAESEGLSVIQVPFAISNDEIQSVLESELSEMILESD